MSFDMERAPGREASHTFADLAEKYVYGESPVHKFKGMTLAPALDDRDRHYLRHIATLTAKLDMALLERGDAFFRIELLQRDRNQQSEIRNSLAASIDQMRGERDRWLASAAASEGLAIHRLFEIDALRETIAALESQSANRFTQAEVNALLAAKDARIAELDSALALRPAAFVDPDPEPAKPNPFRDHTTDPRRIGGWPGAR